MNGLDGKVALVAGGANGVGRATSILLAREGAKVVVSDLDQAGAVTVAEQIRAFGGEAGAVELDLRSESSVAAAVASATEMYGSIDLLHNVGFNAVHVTTKDFDITTTELVDFDEMIAVTLRGYVLTCRAVIPHMVRHGGGAIVNTSSLAAIRSLQTGLRFSYSIAKSGLGPLSQHIAVRYGKQGVRCNTVALGMVVSESFKNTMSPERVRQSEDAVLVPKPAEPDDIAAAVAFLLSDDARYITGQVINVDGGACERYFGRARGSPRRRSAIISRITSLTPPPISLTGESRKQ
jgi:NAD(P)-dependent dehydrogenase (short-subunit alcohol dehydrogenase family)